MKSISIRTCLVFFVSLITLRLSALPIQVVVDGETYRSNQKILLFSGYHEIVFHFPKNIKLGTSYDFRVPEIEKKWLKTSNSSTRYTNLDGGRYIFELCYLDFNNQSVNHDISFEIRENFWEKWWFYLFISIFIILGISLLIYFWFLYDIRQNLRTQAIRHKIAADLHDEVGANLSSIGFLVESLKKNLNGQKEKYDPILDRITGNSQESVILINDIIWALNPDFDNFQKLLERIKSFGLTILSCRDIAFSVDNQLINQSFEINIEDRRDLFFTLKEALNNVAKHSKATKAILRISENDGKLYIRVEDNGVGFDTSEINEGNGLKNFRMRENIEVKVESESLSGTAVRVELNLKNH